MRRHQVLQHRDHIGRRQVIETHHVTGDGIAPGQIVERGDERDRLAVRLAGGLEGNGLDEILARGNQGDAVQQERLLEEIECLGTGHRLGPVNGHRDSLEARVDDHRLAGKFLVFEQNIGDRLIDKLEDVVILSRSRRVACRTGTTRILRTSGG